MKLKNISASIISIGKIVALPGQVVDVTAREYQSNDVINFFIKTNRLVKESDEGEAVKDAKKVRTTAKKADSE